MKLSGKTLAVAGAVLLGLAGAALAAQGAKAMKKDVVKSAESMKWVDGPMKGVHVSNLWGDMTKGGSYGAMIKFDAGMMHPMHSHTQNLRIIVISGTFVHHPEGGAEARLSPGSYLVQMGGEKHVSGCAPGSDCVFFMSSTDKFDFIPAEAAPAAAAPAPAPAPAKPAPAKPATK